VITLGLTGSIGMGKTTVARMFADEGVPVFDADKVVHRLQGSGGALADEIEAQFPGTTGVEGVDRNALAERVLGEPGALQRLEALIHPAVAREREAFVADHAEAALIVLDIPLLFEKGLDTTVDKVAVVSANAETQRLRTLGRPGMTADKFLRILSHQLPDSEKRARADFVIPTDVPMEQTRDSVRRIVACLAAGGDS
jgi:dephospho-CoA kinase